MVFIFDNQILLALKAFEPHCERSRPKSIWTASAEINESIKEETEANYICKTKVSAYFES